MKSIFISLILLVFIITNLSVSNDILESNSNKDGNNVILNLLSNSEDWGERLVDPNFYINKGGTYQYSPYPSDSGVIKIVNTGTEAINLSKPEIISDIKGNGFIYAFEGISLNAPGVLDQIITNQQIQPGESLVIFVVFDPKVNGFHELIIKFPNDGIDTPTSILRGMGVFPKTSTNDLDFGIVEIGSDAVEKTVNFNIVNWENDYPLTITGFEFKETVGVGNFKFINNKIYDKNGNLLSLPVTLEPGNYITVTGEFKPLQEGTFTATLTTVSNAEIEAVSIWTGGGKITGVENDELYGNSLISPNPAEDYITIQTSEVLETSEVSKVQIFDILGLEVGQSSLIDGNIRINVSNLQSGVYFIKIGERVEKFVKM